MQLRECMAVYLSRGARLGTALGARLGIARGGHVGHRSGRTPAISLGELASALQAVCELGLRNRQHGRCLGGDLASRIVLTQVPVIAGSGGGLCGAAVRQMSGGGAEKWKVHQSAVRHALCGHDEGCVGMGVALRELTELATTWGGRDASRYLMEGIRGVLRSMDGAVPLSDQELSESLDLALRERVTPARPSMTKLAGLHSRLNRSGKYKDKKAGW